MEVAVARAAPPRDADPSAAEDEGVHQRNPVAVLEFRVETVEVFVERAVDRDAREGAGPFALGVLFPGPRRVAVGRRPAVGRRLRLGPGDDRSSTPYASKNASRDARSVSPLTMKSISCSPIAVRT